ncbi:MAG: hypothetical protein A2W08_10495 [Candidatus Rokubacteria bacterium RBG_16_73_20]|nr:MAG: hypothetical protein A2050_11010 [Candidatus Rokubacteria bacterium GWA2_73_35]OGK92166.1 MAG: hypothetical protein A2W08_10495 [Candidatus Rokubacteria bacterium RBG_16_73_20]
MTGAARARLRRLTFRRQFYPQLARIVATKLARRGGRGGVFVSMMGGVGDLVNVFPTLACLHARGRVEMGTGGGAYRALVARSPHVDAIWSPFVYQPRRAGHRRIIRAVLRPFYDRVILLDGFDPRWWERRVHLAALYAEACGCPPPARGLVHLAEEDRRRGAAHLERLGLRDFVYVALVIRRRRPLRSWPLAHWHALLGRLAARAPWPVVVDTAGSDETELPDGCRRLPELDLLAKAAVIERARLFVGGDGGLTHVAAALGVPTVAVHLGFPAESSCALGDNVSVVTQAQPFQDPALTTPDAVARAVDARLGTA